MSSFDISPRPNKSDPQTPEALFLTGEGLLAMTPERLQVLKQMMGELGLQVTIAYDLDALHLTPEEEYVPVPASQQDFREFARQKSHTENLANRAWNTAVFTGSPRYQHENPRDPFPRVRFIDEALDTVDLRSIQKRLVASDADRKAWVRAGRGTVEFLMDIAGVVATASVAGEAKQPDSDAARLGLHKTLW